MKRNGKIKTKKTSKLDTNTNNENAHKFGASNKTLGLKTHVPELKL